MNPSFSAKPKLIAVADERSMEGEPKNELFEP
jgi:hypothetical protein